MAEYVPKENKVVILKRGDRAVVWPPYLVVTAGDYITFSTIGVTAKIEFPLELAFERDGSTHSPTEEKPSWSGVEKASGGREAIIRVNPGASYRVKLQDGKDATKELRSTDGTFGERATNMISGNTQIYAYSVFCMEINDFAEGNSSPVILIEPPPLGGGG